MTEGHKSPMIHFTVPIESRNGNINTDSRMVNCFIDNGENGPSMVKRPGTIAGLLYSGGGIPQATGVHNGHVYALISDKVYQLDGVSTATLPSVTVPNQRFQMLSDTVPGKSILKSPTGMWTITGLIIAKITSTDYPTTTTVGAAYLDGAYYVVETSTATGRPSLRGSDIDDPTVWDPLNFIELSLHSGLCVYVGNYLNYIVVMSEQSIQMFYDAGNPTGSPLLPVQSASWLTGCADGNSVVKIVDDLFFVSTSNIVGFAITRIQGLTLSTISTPWIEKIMNSSDFPTIYAQGVKILGHSFYVITGIPSVNPPITLAYDITMGTWAIWTSFVGGVETAFVGVNCTSRQSFLYMQDRISGTNLQLSATSYSDDVGTARGTQPIYTRSVTRPFDWGTLKRKFIGAIYIIADTVASTLTLRYSDTDYATSSAWRTIDLSTVKKMGLRFGSSRRRSWEILHTADTPLRVYGMETEVVMSDET